MPDLTAERLHEIVSPVWEKHPETRPPLEVIGEYVAGRFYATNPEVAALLCEAGMVRWLAERCSDCDMLEIGAPDDDDQTPAWVAIAWTRQWRGEAPTLIEALAAACLSVP